MANQTSVGCPGTSHPQLSCDAVTAIAAVRQADAAERAHQATSFEIGLGVTTAVVAFFAAKFARNAAMAATESYRAFVAAEDAHLVLDFEGGALMETASDGVITGQHYAFEVIVTNVGRSAARLHQLFMRTEEGSAAQSLAQTLKADCSTKLPQILWIDAATGTATISITYATSLRSVANYEATIGVDATSGGPNATAYVASSRIGRPHTPSS